MDPQTVGLVGGIAGGAIGVMGGAIGTYYGIKNTAGPRERAFMIRAAVAMWIAIVAFLAALLSTPYRYQVLLWVPYLLLLMAAIRFLNRRQAQIRSEESSSAGPAL